MRKRKPRLTRDRVQFLKRKTKEAFAERPYLKDLRKRLLRIGGLEVVLWNGSNDETTTGMLLQSGESRSGRKAILQLGVPSDCHENSTRLHRQDPARYEVRTGYALSRDGVWRPHSWVINSSNDTIIETTEKRVTYFGVLQTSRGVDRHSRAVRAAKR